MGEKLIDPLLRAPVLGTRGKPGAQTTEHHIYSRRRFLPINGLVYTGKCRRTAGSWVGGMVSVRPVYFPMKEFMYQSRSRGRHEICRIGFDTDGSSLLCSVQKGDTVLTVERTDIEKEYIGGTDQPPIPPRPLSSPPPQTSLVSPITLQTALTDTTVQAGLLPER